MEKLNDFITINKRPRIKKKLAVVGADDYHTMESVIQAMNKGIITPILIGHKEKIKSYLNEMEQSFQDVNIINSSSNDESAHIAMKAINSGEADFIMKGKIETKELMRFIVNRNSNLRTNNIMSHLTILEIPTYHKLLAFTDAAINLSPNLEEKCQIINNAVSTLEQMGIKCPKVAVLAAAETVNEKLSESTDAYKIKELYLEGKIKNCIIEGPISYDLAISKEAAEIKEYYSSVSGDVDLMVVPNLTAGNICVKGLICSGNAKSSGFIVGAKVPIVMVSRSATAEEKYYSILLAASAC